MDWQTAQAFNRIFRAQNYHTALLEAIYGMVAQYDDNKVKVLIDKLAAARNALQSSIDKDQPFSTKENEMASHPVIDALVAEVTADTGVMTSATLLINGFAARMDAAVQAALAGGATAEQLKPVTDEVAALKAGRDALAAAVAANTPAAPTPQVTSKKR